MMKAGSKNSIMTRTAKRLTTIPNVLSEGTHMKITLLPVGKARTPYLTINYQALKQLLVI